MTPGNQVTREPQQHTRKRKKVFNHFKDLNCGHYHISETRDKKSVDCYSCIKILNDGI